MTCFTQSVQNKYPETYNFEGLAFIFKIVEISAQMGHMNPRYVRK